MDGVTRSAREGGRALSLEERLPVVCVLLLLVASGSGWLALLRHRAESGPEWLGLAFAAGAAWLAVLAVLLAPPSLFRAAVVVPLLFAPFGWQLFRAGARGELRVVASGWMGFLPVLPIVGLAFWFALQRPVHNVDAQRRWVLHAQWTAEHHTPTPEVIEAQEWSFAHPSYPPLVPSVLALSIELGADRDEGMRLVSPAYFLALLGVVFGYARRRVKPVLASALVLVLATTPCLSLLDGYEHAYGLGADSSLADVPLALYLTALAAFVLDALDRGRASPGRASSAWRAAALVGLGAVLTKNEGMAYAPALLAGTWLALAFARAGPARSEARRSAFVAFAVCAAAAATWKLVARDMPVREGEAYLSAGVVGSLAAGFARLPEVGSRLADDFVNWRLWGALWAWPIVWLVWLAARARALERDRLVRSALPALWLAGALVMVAGAYLATGWKDGRWSFLMEVSLARLLAHHAPLALLIACDVLEGPLRERAAAAGGTP